VPFLFRLPHMFSPHHHEACPSFIPHHPRAYFCRCLMALHGRCLSRRFSPRSIFACPSHAPLPRVQYNDNKPANAHLPAIADRLVAWCEAQHAAARESFEPLEAAIAEQDKKVPLLHLLLLLLLLPSSLLPPSPSPPGAPVTTTRHCFAVPVSLPLTAP